MANYETLIPPEVTNDEFFDLIQRLAKRRDVTTILEIGSSSGEGSTAAFVRGMDRNPNQPTLYCIEMSAPRFVALKRRYAARNDVRCYNVSTVPTEKLPSRGEVAAFYERYDTGLNRYPLAEVLQWLEQDLEYLHKSQVPTQGIRLIKQENGIDRFDLVLIDGSAFTGAAELEEVCGARIILLDDVNDIKNFGNYRRLSSDPQYRLISENWKLRNGYAAFEIKSTRNDSRLSKLKLGALRFWPFK